MGAAKRLFELATTPAPAADAADLVVGNLYGMQDGAGYVRIRFDARDGDRLRFTLDRAWLDDDPFEEGGRLTILVPEWQDMIQRDAFVFPDPAVPAAAS